MLIHIFLSNDSQKKICRSAFFKYPFYIRSMWASCLTKLHHSYCLCKFSFRNLTFQCEVQLMLLAHESKSNALNNRSNIDICKHTRIHVCVFIWEYGFNDWKDIPNKRLCYLWSICLNVRNPKCIFLLPPC